MTVVLNLHTMAVLHLNNASVLIHLNSTRIRVIMFNVSIRIYTLATILMAIKLILIVAIQLIARLDCAVPV